MVMVTMAEAGTPPTEGSSPLFNNLPQVSSSASCRRWVEGRSSGSFVVVPSAFSMLLVRGLASGSKIAFSWAAEGCGEAAFEVPHAVATLFELHGAALLLVLVVYGFGAVGVGGIDDRGGEPA